MVNWLHKHLAEGLQDEKGIKGNHLGERLLNLINSKSVEVASEKEIRERLLSGDAKIEESRPPIEQIGQADLRLLHLLVRNIKKYPMPEDSTYYGIPLSYEGEPKSCVWTGSNGVGKTSLYASLEYLGLRTVNTAQIRGYDVDIRHLTPDEVNSLSERNQAEYLKHFGEPLDSSEIHAVCVESEIKWLGKDYKTDVEPSATEAFYCSDFDVSRLEKGKDYTSFFIDQLGLRRYFDIIVLLYGIINAIGKNKIESPSNDDDIQKLNAAIIHDKFQLGVALGLMQLYHFNESVTSSEVLKFLNNPAVQRNRVAFLCSYRSQLTSEKAYFNKYPDFTNAIVAKYAKAISDLRKLEDNAYPVIWDTNVNICNSITQFISFRKNLISFIEGLFDDNHSGSNSDMRVSFETALMRITDNLGKLIEKRESIKEEEKNLPKNYEDIAFEKELIDLTGFLESRLKALLSSWVRPIKYAIETLLSDFFVYDNDKIQVRLEVNPLVWNKITHIEPSKDPRYSIQKYINFDIRIKHVGTGPIQKTDRTVDPRAYMNTFKYKLFCVALKLALSVVSKEIYAINYPLIIDDVFDASDFDSRVGLKDFIQHLVKQHDRIDKKCLFPLQLIFFTQDDLIAKQVEAGLVAGQGRENVMTGRLFDYRDIGEELGMKESNPDMIINCSSQNKDYSYHCLADIIPNYVCQ